MKTFSPSWSIDWAPSVARAKDRLTSLVVESSLPRVIALRCRVFRVSVVDVQPGTVGEHHVDEAAVHVAGSGALEPEATGVAPGGLFLERPLDTSAPAAGRS